MRTWTRITSSLLALRLVVPMVLGAAGCGRPPSHPHDGNHTDAGLDGGVDGGPLRTLTNRRLFGDSPVENRFYDPNFVNIDTTAWSPLNQYTWEVSLATWVFTRTPLDQPALRLMRDEGESRGQVMGLVKSTPGPVEVSIWLGRSVGGSHEETRVSLLGLFTDGTGGIDLQMEDPLTAVALEGIEWVRFSVLIEEGPVAWANLRVINSSEDPLYLTSPQLVRVSMRTWSALLRSKGLRRPLQPEERTALIGYWRRYRDRF